MKFKDSYDYFVVNYTDNNTHTLTCYRFTDLGKQLRKIFIGLGYTYSRDDTTHLNVLPLIACYKAFYDRFIPARDIPFSATAAFGLIQFIEQNPNVWQIQFDLHTDPNGSISGRFTNFVVNCLANMSVLKMLTFTVCTCVVLTTVLVPLYLQQFQKIIRNILFQALHQIQSQLLYLVATFLTKVVT